MKGAIFDWDGTLASIDKREFDCINHALTEHGSKPISREFYINNYNRRAYELGTGPRMVLETALADQGPLVVERAYESYRQVFQNSVDKATVEIGSIDILKSLNHAGFKVGVATMRYARRVVEWDLKHLPVAPYVKLLRVQQDLRDGGRSG